MTDEKIRALARLLEDGASFDEMPDGVTWEDLEVAEALIALKKENPDVG